MSAFFVSKVMSKSLGHFMDLKRKLILAIPLGIIFGVGGFAAYNFFGDKKDGIADVKGDFSQPNNEFMPANDIQEEVVEIAPLDLKKAFAIAFGIPEGASFANVKGYKFTPQKLLDVGTQKVLVSIGAMEDGAHVYGGRVAVDYFANGANGYEFNPAKHYELETGSWGNLSEWGINTKLLNNPTIAVEGGGTFQGVTCAKTSIIELSAKGAKEVFSEITMYDNSGFKVDEDSESLEGKITNIVKGKSFDVVYKGTKDFTINFQYDGNKFVPTGGDINNIKDIC